MDCSFYKSKDYILKFYESKEFESIAHVYEFRNKQICFIEATHKIDPTEFTDEIYLEISKICDVKSVYVDLSNIYGADNSSWLMRWDFIIDTQRNLIDERFSVMKDLKNIEKNEYIILKHYINEKQCELLICI